MLFADRLEVWNPGELPSTLTIDKLRLPHASIPHNPLIADPLFLARYIEKAGTGTLDMIARCREAGLPKAVFKELDLNSRQRKALIAARAERRLTTARHQEWTKTSRTTAKRDLEELVQKGVLIATGAGRGAAYEISVKRPRNGSIGSSAGKDGNGS